MKVDISFLLRHDSLNDDDNRVYRNFNYILLFGLADMVIVARVLYNVQPEWPFYLAVTEMFLLMVMLVLHCRGWFLIARLATFLITILFQAMAALTHGPGSGFDYIFFIISVLPMMFFRSARYYLPLFVISIIVHLIVVYQYNEVKPIIILNTPFLYYWNIFFTSAIIFSVMFFFKRGYQRSQESLEKKNSLITLQKEEIESINNNLEQLVRVRTQKLRDQDAMFLEMANINAHRVRSPLARIQGLLKVIELEEDKHRALGEILPLIKANAEELNDILTEVGDTLNNINSEDKF